MTKGKCILPNSAQILDEEALFRLLFNDEVLDIIVRCTNSNAARKREEFINSSEGGTQRPWKSVNRLEILSYIGIILYMGIHIEPHQDMYWNITTTTGPVHTA